MGSFTATTPSTKGANTATKRTGSAPATSHADQIQGALAAPPPAPAAPVAPAYTHADQIQGAGPAVNGFRAGEHDMNLPPLNRFPDPLNSPWLNPTRPP
ncbi:MAG: hypothetical protein RH946_08705 [Rhodospirillales bacterium]